MELFKADKIKEIEARLQNAKFEKLKQEQQVSALQAVSADIDFEIDTEPTQQENTANASLIEQLARAHCLLQNAYLAEESPEKPGMAQIVAFLENLSSELDENVHAAMLERSGELQADNYGLQSIYAAIMPSIELTKDEEIMVLQERLQKAIEEKRQLQNRIDVLQTASDNDLERAILIEELARAYCHLQNIYLADREPETYEKPDLSQVSEWLVSLEDAVGEDTNAMVLDKTEWLNNKKYAYKGVDIGITDITASRNMRRGHGFS
ncbi:hypothetical protein HII31_06544 [Pseudocercospora fuligena]|uniref:Uncharacterized protein n=1 Tax=Pseudocercospora fuligena TaxID=685502 RepID=A0A8H6RJT1_9PEZI|nr:hypothetical protein HII31_06544 [Pseudocercospora fuligena]